MLVKAEALFGSWGTSSPSLGRDADREAGRRSGVGNNLASADTKPGPGSPAELHGGCTEPGLIRGTRPNELITGLRFPTRPAAIPPRQGGGASCSHRPRLRRAWCQGREGAPVQEDYKGDSRASPSAATPQSPGPAWLAFLCLRSSMSAQGCSPGVLRTLDPPDRTLLPRATEWAAS